MSPGKKLPFQLYDESIPIGKDFTDQAVVAAYDARHRKFRDIDGENAAIIAGLGLQSDWTLAEFGCGTGAFTLMAASRCARVHAVDVSQAMLDFTASKARNLGLINTDFHHAGFLTYVHSDPPLDAIVSGMALHHLPDFWKRIALRRLNVMLKSGGRFHLTDVAFDDKKCEVNIAAWIDKLSAQVGSEMADDLNRHIAKEYSTLSWIMEGLLTRAGFRIDNADYIDGALARYYCTKTAALSD